MRQVTRFGAVLLAVVVGAGLVACGDDDDTPSGGTTSGGAGSEAACDAYIGFTQGFNEEEPDSEAIGTALDDLEAAAPEDISDELAVVISTSREALETGEFDFESEEFVQAQATTDNFFFENCDAETKVDVSAVDYEFQGPPEEVTAGEVAFRMANNGAELHEMVLLRKKDDTEETFDEIFDLPEEESFGLVDVTFVAFGFPGTTRANWVDLEAGEYSMVCFIPVGSTPDAGEEGGDGPPHFLQGMRHDFEVT